jgi:hypothetical protein
MPQREGEVAQIAAATFMPKDLVWQIEPEAFSLVYEPEGFIKLVCFEAVFA